MHAPRAAAAGCVVIDNSSLYRYDPAIPLIVPEVNADAIEMYPEAEEALRAAVGRAPVSHDDSADDTPRGWADGKRERVQFVDADLLPLQNMDSLFG